MSKEGSSLQDVTPTVYTDNGIYVLELLEIPGTIGYLLYQGPKLITVSNFSLFLVRGLVQKDWYWVTGTSGHWRSSSVVDRGSQPTNSNSDTHRWHRWTDGTDLTVDPGYDGCKNSSGSGKLWTSIDRWVSDDLSRGDRGLTKVSLDLILSSSTPGSTNQTS